MSDIRYIRPELVEAIARNTIKKFDPTLLTGGEIRSIPIEDMIEKFGLSLEFQYIRKNGRILGETVFDSGYIPLYNMTEQKYELVFMERGTIIIDAARYDFVICPNCGRGRLCDKPRGSKISVLQIHGKGRDHVIVKCYKCSSRYLIGMKYHTGFKCNPQAKWTAVAVGRILKNPLYIRFYRSGKNRPPEL